MSIEAVSPHNLEAERSVLGAILLHGEKFGDAAAVVCADDFFRDAHHIVFQHMAALSAKGVAIDTVTLTESLTTARMLETVGGQVYIADLMVGIPRSANIEHYARIVKEKARARTLIAYCNQAIAEVSGDSDALTTRGGPFLEAVQRLMSASESSTIPGFETLRARLARPRVPLQYRIADLQPLGTRVMLAAQYKAGKTSLVGNLVRSLVDGDPFLGRYDVMPVSGAVGVLDFEMGSQLDDWFADQRIAQDDQVLVLSMRGQAARFNIIDARIRAAWAAMLKANGVRYVILDCLRPVLDALGLDEHRDGGQFLTAFDALLYEAGIGEALLVHHMGHNMERSRGDSRFRDWPDAEWRLVRQDDDPASARFLSAFGRDVEVAEAQLAYDRDSRRLTIAGGTRREAALSPVLADIMALLSTFPDGLNGVSIKSELKKAGSEHGRNAIDNALKVGTRDDHLLATRGGYNATVYRVSLFPGSFPVNTREARETSFPVSRAPIGAGKWETVSKGDRTSGRVRI